MDHPPPRALQNPPIRPPCISRYYQPAALVIPDGAVAHDPLALRPRPDSSHYEVPEPCDPRVPWQPREDPGSQASRDVQEKGVDIGVSGCGRGRGRPTTPGAVSQTSSLRHLSLHFSPFPPRLMSDRALLCRDRKLASKPGMDMRKCQLLPTQALI